MSHFRSQPLLHPHSPSAPSLPLPYLFLTVISLQYPLIFLFFSHLPHYSKQSFSPSLLFLQLVSSVFSLLSSSCFLRVPGFPSPTLPLHPSNSILPLCITHQTLSSPQDLSLSLSLSLSAIHFLNPHTSTRAHTHP